MKRRTQWILVVLFPILFVACDGTVFTPAGQEDYAALITVGNSLTAGYLNSALIEGGQRASFANLMSQAINGREMSLPTICDGCSGNRGVGPGGAGMLYVDPATGSITADPLTIPAQAMALNLTFALPYENLGVPFAFAWDVLNATSADSSFTGINAGSPNSYVDLVIRNSYLSGKATPLGQAARLAAADYAAPKTLSLWIGSNDVLLGASSGEPALGVSVTPPQVIGAIYQGIEAQVKAMGFEQVVVANIPGITSIPLVTTINPVAQVVDGTPIYWNTDEDDVQYILLPAQTLLFVNGQPNADYLPGGEAALPPELTLDADEAALLNGAVDDYNAVIEGIAAANGWALVDVNQALKDLPRDPFNQANYGQLNGIFSLVPPSLLPPGLPFNPNSAFSLDGTHPSEKGHAYVAGLFLEALNDTYGTSYQSPDPDQAMNMLGFEALFEAQAAPAHWGMSRAAAKAIQGAMGASVSIWDELPPVDGGR